MGLDVTLIRPVLPTQSTGSIILECDDPQYRVLDLFKDLIQYEDIKYIDWTKVFNRRKMKFEDYSMFSQCGSQFRFYKNSDHIEGQPLPEDYQFFEYNCRKNTPVNIVTEPVLYYETVGWQRKGANSQFYEDGNWETGGYITTLNEAWQHYYLYFAPPWVINPSYPEPSNSQDNFKECILDKFVEGKTVICYW